MELHCLSTEFDGFFPPFEKKEKRKKLLHVGWVPRTCNRDDDALRRPRTTGLPVTLVLSLPWTCTQRPVLSLPWTCTQRPIAQIILIVDFASIL